MSNFIGQYFISESICNRLIDYYNENSHMIQHGVTYDLVKGQSVVDFDYKKSLDLSIGAEDKHQPIYDFRLELQKCLDEYIKEHTILKTLGSFTITERINIQYYPIGGGFKRWHCERTGLKDGDRQLVFMTYLNDVPDGGTEFAYYPELKIEAKKGLTLFWPSDWTHTHRGIVSNTKEKIIITGWYSYV